MYVNHKYIQDNPSITVTKGQTTSVMCSALSDPKSQITIRTERGDLSTDHGCNRVDGLPPQLWNCSVSVDIEYSEKTFQLQCEIIFKGSVIPTKLRNVTGK